MRKFAIFFVVTTFLIITSLKFTHITTFYNQIKKSIKTTNWIRVIRKIDDSANQFNILRKKIKIDISAGSAFLSSPDQNEITSNLLSLELADDEDHLVRKSPILWAHQVGKKVVRKVPDTALLGALVLILSELLRRGVNSNSDTLPPVIREFANATIIELDSKLEMLSSLEWKVDPFFKVELENLQSQPLEVIDRFIVQQILPSVDKDFAPFLLKYMVGDAKRVKTITQSVKDLIQLSTVLLEGTSMKGPNVLDRTTSNIIEQVDLVGQSIEEVVNDWNRIVVRFTGSITEYLTTDSVLNLINKQFAIKTNTNTTNIMKSNENINASSDVNSNSNSNSNINKKDKRTFIWNSALPWRVTQEPLEKVEADSFDYININYSKNDDILVNNNENIDMKNKNTKDNDHHVSIKNRLSAMMNNFENEDKEKPLNNFVKKKNVGGNDTNNRNSSSSCTNSNKKVTTLNTSAFSSYLQDLME